MFGGLLTNFNKFLVCLFNKTLLTQNFWLYRSCESVCHPRECGDPEGKIHWIPAFAGMTGADSIQMIFIFLIIAYNFC